MTDLTNCDKESFLVTKILKFIIEKGGRANNNLKKEREEHSKLYSQLHQMNGNNGDFHNYLWTKSKWNI